MDAEQFHELWHEFDGLDYEISELIRVGVLTESEEMLDRASVIVNQITSSAENTTQKNSAKRIEARLRYLNKEWEEIHSKRETGKKEDGNVALKCNWNDREYMAPCSEEAYDYNLSVGSTFCSSDLCQCRDLVAKYGDDVNTCYESVALKDLFFGAGWNLEKDTPRTMRSVKEKSMAVLTTIPPGKTEEERIIVGCFVIINVIEDPGKETQISGVNNEAIILPFDDLQINFWDFYKNPNAEQTIKWSYGLFRYMPDEGVLNMLREIGEKYTNSGRDIALVNELIKKCETRVND